MSRHTRPGDNGIDFSNIAIEFVPAVVPEPASLSLLALGLAWAARRPRQNAGGRQ